MALPTLERSYEFDVNNAFVSTGDANVDGQYYILNIHQAMTGMTNNPWTVAGSSNGSSYGYPGPGWSGISDLVWGGELLAQNKSWMIWNLPNGGQWLFACAHNTSGDAFRWYAVTRHSPEGLFTGGGLQTLPSAVDQIEHHSRSFFWFGGNAAASVVQHYIHSTDGLQSIILGCRNGVACQAWMVGEVLGPVAGFTNPYFFHDYIGANAFATERPTYSDLLLTKHCSAKKALTGDAGLTFKGMFSTEGINSNAVGEGSTIANEISGEWPMTKIGFFSNDPWASGRHGRVADLWFTASALATGDTVEEDPLFPTYNFAVFGDLVVPWNGTIPQVSV